MRKSMPSPKLKVKTLKSKINRQNPIGVFDSGIGGLTVVRSLKRILPNENIIYLGDTARVPYGIKSPEAITRFAFEDTRFLVNRKVKLVVVACHSVSSVCLPELKKSFSVPMIGVIEPGARAALAATKNRRIGVIGTQATIIAGTYERVIREIAKREGVSINQFISSAVSEKISALITEDYLRSRAKRAKKEDFRKILAKVPRRQPIAGDELKE
jgi:glutamate racemase